MGKSNNRKWFDDDYEQTNSRRNKEFDRRRMERREAWERKQSAIDESFQRDYSDDE